MPKDPNEKVVVWENTTGRHLRRDSRRDGGGIGFKPDGAMVITEKERAQRGTPPSNITERVMTRKEAYERYGKNPIHDND